jgi:septal ring factor EnvC (AmiA/AmiB activator)
VVTPERSAIAAMRRTAHLAAAVLAVLLAACRGAGATDSIPAPGKTAPTKTAPAPAETGRETIEQWVQTRSLIGKEKQDWRVGREIMKERIELLRREIDSLREKTAQATNALTNVDAKLADLRDEKTRLKEASAELLGSVGGMEARLRVLLAETPDPVRDRVKPLAVRMPADSANTKIALSERLQVIVGVLNELTKANGEIVQAVEIRPMPDGKSAEVRSAYVGLAQGYYVSARGDAGIGRAGTNGWQWTAADELAEPIRQVLDILQNKGSPRFVPLPGEVR